MNFIKKYLFQSYPKPKVKLEYSFKEDNQAIIHLENNQGSDEIDVQLVSSELSEKIKSINESMNQSTTLG